MQFYRGVNALDMIHQLVLFIRGTDDEDGAGVGDRLRHFLEKDLILVVVLFRPLLLAMMSRTGDRSGWTTILSASSALKWKTRACR